MNEERIKELTDSVIDKYKQRRKTIAEEWANNYLEENKETISKSFEEEFKNSIIFGDSDTLNKLYEGNQ